MPREITGALDVLRLVDERDEEFHVVEIEVNGETLHVELDVLADLAMLRAGDEDAFESVADLISLFNERGAPMQALDG
jgi:hypothetical protein